MGRTYDRIDDGLKGFLESQPVFFVATAPLDADGHVNVSPKGLDSFRVLGPTTAAYLDLTGSGVETIAHLRENGRITLMFCAFDDPPRIIRLYGRGETVVAGSPDFEELAALFPPQPGVRSIIRTELDRISTSCGYGVPLMDFRGARTRLTQWAERKGPDGIVAYWDEQNGASLDGLPGLDPRPLPA